MPSGQTGPRPMNMPFGGGMMGGNPFGGFGGMFPQQPQQPHVYTQLPTNYQPQIQPEPAQPVKNYGPVGGMLNSAQNQVNPQQPSGPTGAFNNTLGSIPGQQQPAPPTGGVTPMPAGFNPASAPQTMNINDPIKPIQDFFGPGGPQMPSMGGVAPGMGRGKGRTGPGTSGGFSGGCGVTPRGMM